jgi:hypothetical protein
MTTVNRRIARECSAAVRECGKQRCVIVEIEPPGRVIGFRLKGTRRTFLLPIEACYRLAVQAHVDAERRAAREKK